MNPWVWVTHDHRMLGSSPLQSAFTVLGDKYALAVKECALAEPVTFPTATAHQIPELLAQCDGVLLTGSPSNIHPSHYAQNLLRPELPLDPQRDALSLPLIRACIDNQVPMLGICRGFQEINVSDTVLLDQGLERDGLHHVAVGTISMCVFVGIKYAGQIVDTILWPHTCVYRGHWYSHVSQVCD